MFISINKTEFSPKSKPILIWDGKCGFCKYWVLRLKMLTNNQIEFKSFQDIGNTFPDIPIQRFKEASRLIDTTGEVYSGPDSFYKSLYYKQVPITFLHRSYCTNKVFKLLSDFFYTLIADNRNLSFKITKILFGNNPLRFTHYWLFYMLIIIIIIML